LFTWGELITMGLTMFAVLATIWFARPVKYTMPLKFILASITGYAVGGLAGIIQANYASNRFFHNTQWVIGIHGHIQLLVGLSSTLFAAIYALFPLLTGRSLNEKLGNIHLLLWSIGGLIMGLSMGMAGTLGMLRRTLYPMGLGPFEPYMIVATLGALMMATAFIAFIVNILKTIKLTNLLKILF